jgi:hypothetical protein
MNTTLIASQLLADRDCTECERLWQELSDAAKAYVRIFGQHKGVDGRRRATPYTKLELRVAAEHRNWARKALKNHEVIHGRDNRQALNQPPVACTLF